MRFKTQFILLFILIFNSAASYAGPTLEGLFKVKKPVIAALYLELPNDLNDAKAKADLIQWGLAQQQILEAEGVDAILWEYQAGEILQPPLSRQEVDVMSEVILALSRQTPLVVGVEVLWHYPEATLEVAKRGEAKFVRLDFFSDHMRADGKEVPIDPSGILQFRHQIGAEQIALLTDIQVKYAEMIDPRIKMAQSARRALAAGSEAVIVSGQRSGQAPGVSRVRQAKRGAGSHDVIIGSGFSFQNARSLLRSADAAIVGTSISEKTGGPLVQSKVRQLMDVVKDIRQSQSLDSQ